MTIAWPYVNGVALDNDLSPWRRDTAKASLAQMGKARTVIAAELAVANP